MNANDFISPLGPVMARFIALKQALGRRYDSERRILGYLDTFLNPGPAVCVNSSESPVDRPSVLSLSTSQRAGVFHSRPGTSTLIRMDPFALRNTDPPRAQWMTAVGSG